jgi:peptidoglycan/LPS O-acetylase OafA/YrhL
MDSPRSLMLHYMRGIACLMVVFFHLVSWNIHKYWKGVEAIVGNNIFIPLLPDNVLNDLSKYDVQYSEWFGTFGVSLFFLITGFVIPISLARHNPITFLVNRVFRIYPAYLASLAILGVDCKR